MHIYKQQDMTDQFKETIFRAKKMWMAICKENFEKDGDKGSCVLGAGITIMLLLPKCRKPRRTMIIASNEVAQCQGSANWEKGNQQVLSFLSKNGIEAAYECGNMD
jgi:hypothetical protein